MSETMSTMTVTVTVTASTISAASDASFMDGAHTGAIPVAMRVMAM